MEGTIMKCNRSDCVYFCGDSCLSRFCLGFTGYELHAVLNEQIRQDVAAWVRQNYQNPKYADIIAYHLGKHE